MIRRLLIANRGEIAVRVMRTARAMGMTTIGVYSDADRGALHVEEADVAYRIGPAPARESYLAIDAVLAAAERAGADAIHPGYGFLSENAEFAEACAAAGLIFVGPPAAAIRAMGDKSAAKALMRKAGVPIVAGYHGMAQDAATFEAEARKVGYPVLVKASAGGGGKGMKVAASAAELAEAVASAKREAASAFGDDRVLLERYLEAPRHVEVQIFADTHGNAVHLFERDCSLQRRHQKVIEEAPAPGLPAELRGAMGATAVAAARAVGYVGAGTVEFLLDARSRYTFMEMNTRLQVEHPVSEAVTGQDLVAWQLRVAAGEPLPVGQGDLAVTGHAIEARLYAEDAARGFLPQAGVIEHLRFPDAAPGLRIEAGVRTGDRITTDYDPMIAKVIVHAADREAALRGLVAALSRTEIAGLTTNRTFLLALLRHSALAAGAVDTGFIGRHEAELTATAPLRPRTVALATVRVLEKRAADARAAASPHDPWSPWAMGDGWRTSDHFEADIVLREPKGGLDHRVAVRRKGRACRMLVADAEFDVALDDGYGSACSAMIDGQLVSSRQHWSGQRLTLFDDHETTVLDLVDPLAGRGAAGTTAGQLTAPMPGRITVVHVAAGAEVAAGAPLVVLEAMKMEHTLRAPAAGRVAAVLVSAGAQVAEGTELVRFEAARE